MSFTFKKMGSHFRKYELEVKNFHSRCVGSFSEKNCKDATFLVISLPISL